MRLEVSGFYNMDCMEGMKEFPDNFFDLAIVDPPYGSANNNSWDKAPRRVIRTGGSWAKKYGRKISRWDIAPDKSYFDELFRVAKNQIIWGGNYFGLPPTRCFLVWDKMNISENFSMAMCEYAWCSFNDNAKIFKHIPQGNNERRIHPTQKPVKLYEWILSKFAKEGDVILDTHAGSASSLIACINGGFKYVGFELDEDYYKAARERLDVVASQMRMF